MSTIKGKLQVALVHSSGKTVTEVARDIGVSAEGLRNWV
ncbi:transposase, partial [Streptomyces sp. NPDC057557]